MNEESMKQKLFELADAYTAATGASTSAIGKHALNDNTFFSRVREGATFTMRTFDKLIGWFSENWPDETDWPLVIPRPSFCEPEIPQANEAQASENMKGAA